MLLLHVVHGIRDAYELRFGADLYISFLIFLGDYVTL